MRYLNYPKIIYNKKGRKTCARCKGSVRQVRYRKNKAERVLFCDHCRRISIEVVIPPKTGDLDKYLKGGN